MTLPSSFPLSVSQINVELGRAANAPFSINGAEERALAGVLAGPIAFSDFLGKPTGGGVASGAFLVLLGLPAGSSPSISGVSFGTADATRRIFCCVHWNYSGGVHFSLSSATIGGASAAIHTQGGHSGGSTGFGVAIISAMVPTGTTGTIAASFGGTVSSSIGVSRAVNLQNPTVTDTLFASSAGSTGTLSTTINVASGGILLTAYSPSSLGGSAYNNMLGVTERYTTAPPNGGVGGLSTNLAAQGSRPVSAQCSVVSNAGNTLVGLSWS